MASPQAIGVNPVHHGVGYMKLLALVNQIKGLQHKRKENAQLKDLQCSVCLRGLASVVTHLIQQNIQQGVRILCKHALT